MPPRPKHAIPAPIAVETPAVAPPKPEVEKAERRCRYEICLVKKDDPMCFVKVKQSTALQDAKDQCMDIAVNEGRECIVWDNEGWAEPIVFRHMPEKDDRDVTKTTTTGVTATRRGPRPKHRVDAFDKP